MTGKQQEKIEEIKLKYAGPDVGVVVNGDEIIISHTDGRTMITTSRNIRVDENGIVLTNLVTTRQTA